MLPREIAGVGLLCWLAVAQTPVEQSAVSDIQAGKYAEAEAALKAATQQHARDAELWNLLGITESELGKKRESEQAFDRGLGIAPASISLNENAGLLFFREGRYGEAKKRLERAVELGSDKPGVRFSLAASKLRSGEAAEALAELKRLEAALGNRPEYWEERGRAELLRNPAGAEASFGKALKLAPGSLTALNGAAIAAEREGLDEKALAYLIRARTASPDNVPTLEHFANVCIRRDLGPDAISALERARKLEPANSTVLYLLARANISVQKWQRAFDLFHEFSERRPKFAAAYYALGWLDIKLGRVEDARRQLERSLSLDPSAADVRYELAQLEFDDSHMDKARSLLEAILRNDPGHARANTLLGEILMRNGDLAGAKELLGRAVAADPQLAAAHYQLSQVYAREHQEQKAGRERAIAVQLSAEEKRRSKTQLRLVLPENAESTNGPRPPESSTAR